MLGRHRSEPLKQGPRNSACGMGRALAEFWGNGKEGAAGDRAKEGVAVMDRTRGRDFKALGGLWCPAVALTNQAEASRLT